MAAMPAASFRLPFFVAPSTLIRKLIGTPFSLHVDTSRNCAGTVLAPLLCFRCGNSSGAEEAGDVDGRRISRRVRRAVHSTAPAIIPAGRKAARWVP